MGDSKASIDRTVYEMLLLRFGGASYHEIIFTSFLDLYFYKVETFGLHDISFLYLPDIQIMHSKGCFEITNYYKLLKKDRITEQFEHDIQNEKYNHSIIAKIEKNITNYAAK
ncbi:hypothetical protein [Flavivirga spongiicola]|uniref:Uncharacterized protein n=2 Tax=Flavivirga spongiicola TaxID=421621 RepID=A0ABU7XZB6_9FLAO|nr:hypothetical protein [Flavivirga sp. MEBiC05379]MDO5980912.1 hypothetical protein [Flavivirga sp. MEBiC05379]